MRASTDGTPLLLIEHRLLTSIVSILGSLVACGTTANTPVDAGEAGVDGQEPCGALCCDSGAESTFTTAYTVCTLADASTLDAADDGGDAAACYANCFEACEGANPPFTIVVGCDDNDSGAMRVALCATMSTSNPDCTGRRTDGLVEPASPAESLGETLGRAAWLEAASVHAFRRLARELRAHSAPRHLIRAALTSARDERRHARMMPALAERHGATVAAVVFEDSPSRDLESIVRENAIEACVVETFGAVLAAWQSEHANDPEIRAAMRAIAPDELRHAALGWAVAEWIESRLSAEARTRVEGARAEAMNAWLQRCGSEPPKNVASELGSPPAAVAKALATAMVTRGVWRREAADT